SLDSSITAVNLHGCMRGRGLISTATEDRQRAAKEPRKVVQRGRFERASPSSERYEQTCPDLESWLRAFFFASFYAPLIPLISSRRIYAERPNVSATTFG